MIFGVGGVLIEDASILIEVGGQHSQAGAIMEILSSVVEGFTEMVVKEIKSSMAVEVLKMLAEGPTPMGRMPTTGESIGASIATLPGCTTRVFNPSWTIREDDSVHLDSLKARELMSGIISPVDVMLF